MPASSHVAASGQVASASASAAVGPVAVAASGPELSSADYEKKIKDLQATLAAQQAQVNMLTQSHQEAQARHAALQVNLTLLEWYTS